MGLQAASRPIYRRNCQFDTLGSGVTIDDYVIHEPTTLGLAALAAVGFFVLTLWRNRFSSSRL
jgi:hypothetical protein